MKKLIKYGKPSGLTLRAHTDNVKSEAKTLSNKFPFWANKYSSFFNKDLDRLVQDAAEYHDYGKAYPIWRDACAKDVALYHAWLLDNGHTVDKVNRQLHHKYEEERKSRQLATAPNLFRAGFRHEFGSVEWLRQHRPHTDDEIVTAIAAHHGKLNKSKYAIKRWRDDGSPNKGFVDGRYYKYFKNFLSTEIAIAEQKSFEQVVRYRYRYAAVRALLQLADTRASRREGMGENMMVPVLPFTAPKGFGSNTNLRPVQREAVKSAIEWRTILRAPTGSGKTYASLLWAEQQILSAFPRADRLVIAMPTRFTSNSLRNAVEEQLPPIPSYYNSGDEESQVGLYHSSAFFSLYGDQGDIGRGSKQVEGQKLACYLAKPVTVCTIDHLLACLTGTRDKHFSTFFFLANSCVVFDETDFYDEFVQANIQTILDVLEILKVPTLIMSATVPNSAGLLYRAKKPIVEAAQPKAKLINKQLTYLGTSNYAVDSAEFLDKMLKNRQGIIYANTVARALNYYDYLSPKVNDIPLTIYHSRFTELDKKRIEQELEASLGKAAHLNEAACGIVIMTQIGEMSINISANLMLTDCCPWDRLAQRVGRLARFSNDSNSELIAQLGVVEPIDDEGQPYAWPYVHEIVNYFPRKGKSYEPILPYLKTLVEIKSLGQIGSYRLTPEILVERTNSLYEKGIAFSNATKENQFQYRSLIRHNWLLTGDSNNNDDDTITNNWRSRNIADQVTVLIEEPPPHFYSFSDFQNFAIKFGVSCPLYKVSKELRKKEGDENVAINETLVSIGPKKAPKDHLKHQTVYYATKGAYSKRMGLLSLYGYSWQPDQFL